MINTRKLDLNKIKTDEKPYKYILSYYIGYVMVKNLSYTKIISVSLLYLIINKVNRYIEENSGNKYLILVPSDESKDTLKKNYKLWIKIRNLIESTTNNPDNYDQKYMKIKFHSHDD